MLGHCFSNEGQNIAECQCWIFRKAAFLYGLLITRMAMMGEGLEMRMIRGVVKSVNASALSALLPVIGIFPRGAEPHIQIGAVKNGDA